MAPRQSLPQFVLNKVHKKCQARQSIPGTDLPKGEDIFESKFVVLEVMGKGAFSQVVKVKDRQNDAVYAIKKARGVFEGVKDRLVPTVNPKVEPALKLGKFAECDISRKSISSGISRASHTRT